MIHYVLRAVDFSDTNVKINNLNQIESEVNAFIKNAQVTVVNIAPMMHYDPGTEAMIVGAMINYDIARR